MFALRLRASNTLIVVVCISLVIVFNTSMAEKDVHLNKTTARSEHKSIVKRFYQKQRTWRLSKLGEVLFKHVKYPKISKEKRNKKITILIWKHFNAIQNRHIYNFGPVRQNPLNGCSVKNCEFTGDDNKLQTADAVIVHLQRGQIPSLENRNPRQRWIFLNDEAPYNAFGFAQRVINLSEMHNVFNWSMTYSPYADVPVPYGRTVALGVPKFSSLEPSLADLLPNRNQKRRDVLVAILVSNCVQYRMKLINELKKYIPVNVHGSCGDNELKKSCPGHFRVDCKLMFEYLFYLALENSKCRDYMTEKLFHNAYARGAIPIIQGPSIEECKIYLPPNSYLHVDNYATVKDLADDIVRISKDENKLRFYHEWRNHFKVVNEHGYFGSKSFHLCRACEAMNYNINKKSVYSEQNLRQFLDPSVLCRK